MENLHEQNSQTPEPEKPQEPQNNMNQAEITVEMDRSTFDFDTLDDTLYPGVKAVGTSQQNQESKPTISPASRSSGSNLRLDEIQPSKKKRPAKDIFPGFYISVNNLVMTFFFSKYALDQDTRFSKGNDYFYRRFSLFSDAITFYEENLKFYITKSSVQQIKNYYKRQWDLINNPGYKQPGAMW